MTKSITILFLFSLLIIRVNAQNLTINGYLVDADTQEPLIGANVYVLKTLEGTSTNKFGYFALKIKSPQDSVCFSYVGYTSKVVVAKECKNNMLVALNNGTALNQIMVVAEKKFSNSVIQPLSINSEVVKLLPNLTGEADLMKAYQYLPGVSGGTEGNNSIYVRGGSPDQNLILLDDVPLYYVNHIGGIVSVFDENAISDVEIYKSGFPARYGGRLSSVIDVRMKNGSLEKIGGVLSVGVISSKIHLHGPIVKNKASFMVTIRKSMTDFYLKPISYFAMNKDAFLTYSFYDFNAKINWKVNDKNRLYLSAYSGNDNTLMGASVENDEQTISIKNNLEEYYYEASNGNNWGNRLVCFRWNHVFGTSLFSNLSVASTKYFYSSNVENTISLIKDDDFIEKYNYSFASGIHDNLAKFDVDYFMNNKVHFKLGTSFTNHNFDTGKLHNLYDINEDILSDSSALLENLEAQVDTVFGSQKIVSNEFEAYFEGDVKLLSKLNINAGIHFTTYNVDGYSNSSIQPRFALKYLMTKNISFSGAYSHMVQNLHMLSGGDVSTPTDIWLPATNTANAESSDQICITYNQFSDDKKYNWRVEGYYKTMKNLIDYKLGYSFTNSSEQWYNKIETGGIGWCYGVEFLFEKQKGDFTGWFAYTLSKNMRQFEGINNNVPFEYVYDKPHDLSIVANYRYSDRITFSATWEYNSGRKITLGTAAYENNRLRTHFDQTYQIESYYYTEKGRHQFVDFYNDVAIIYGTKNNYRLPDFHKLNISVNLTKQKKRGTRTWVFGIQNVYNRMNAYNVYYTINDDGTFEMNKITMFPIMPNFSYSFRF